MVYDVTVMPLEMIKPLWNSAGEGGLSIRSEKGDGNACRLTMIYTRRGPSASEGPPVLTAKGEYYTGGFDCTLSCLRDAMIVIRNELAVNVGDYHFCLMKECRGKYEMLRAHVDGMVAKFNDLVDLGKSLVRALRCVVELLQADACSVASTKGWYDTFINYARSLEIQYDKCRAAVSKAIELGVDDMRSKRFLEAIGIGMDFSEEASTSLMECIFGKVMDAFNGGRYSRWTRCVAAHSYVTTFMLPDSQVKISSSVKNSREASVVDGMVKVLKHLEQVRQATVQDITYTGWQFMCREMAKFDSKVEILSWYGQYFKSSACECLQTLAPTLVDGASISCGHSAPCNLPSSLSTACQEIKLIAESIEVCYTQLHSQKEEASTLG